MRRVLSLMAAGLLGLAGCCHTHGVCDCEIDDYCTSRQPWLVHGPVAGLPGPLAAPVGEALPLPRGGKIEEKGPPPKFDDKTPMKTLPRELP